MKARFIILQTALCLLLLFFTMGTAAGQPTGTPFAISSNDTVYAYPGETVDIPVIKTAGSELMYGFDFLMDFDHIALGFIEIIPGGIFNDSGTYRWEYFNYRFDEDSGLVRIVGVADTNNGDVYPLTYEIPDGTVLFTLRFNVTNDPTMYNLFIPIRFAWNDCSDNVIAASGGDSLFLSYHVYNAAGNDITDTLGVFPTFGGAPQECLADNTIDRFIDFYSGGVYIADMMAGERGDMNCNGIAYEMADWVIFYNYFLNCFVAFGDNAQCAIQNSDINGDRKFLSIEDLSYIQRVICGLEEPMQGVGTPDFDTVYFSHDAETKAVSVQYHSNLTAVTVVFYGEIHPNFLVDTDIFDCSYAIDTGITRIIIAPNLSNCDAELTPGLLFTYSGTGELVGEDPVCGVQTGAATPDDKTIIAVISSASGENHLPIIVADSIPNYMGLTAGEMYIFPVSAYDIDGPVPSLAINITIDNFTFVDSGNGNGYLQVMPDVSQIGQTYSLRFIAHDGDPAYPYDSTISQNFTFSVTGQSTEDIPFLITIGNLGNVQPGETVLVPVRKMQGNKLCAGFDYTIGFDNNLLTLTGCIPGPLFDESGTYQWPTFYWRMDTVTNCTADFCPPEVLKVYGIAESFESGSALSYDIADSIVLFTMEFTVADIPQEDTLFVPVNFFFADCISNSMSNYMGDSLLVSQLVLDAFGRNITDPEYGVPGIYGAPDSCYGEAGNGPYRFIDFQHGIIGINGTGSGGDDTTAYEIAIDNLSYVMPGSTVLVPIRKMYGQLECGAFDLTIGYENSLLTLVDCIPGRLFDANGEYQWATFSWREDNPPPDCEGDFCPDGLIKTYGFAESITEGPPLSYDIADSTVLFTLKFIVAESPQSNCQFIPVNFYFTDCVTNSLSNITGDSLLVTNLVFDASGQNITDVDYGVPGIYGPPDTCYSMTGSGPYRFVNFSHGGLDVNCDGPAVTIGDINLDGVTYTLADYVLLVEYFIFGDCVFTEDPQLQKANSDLNRDGEAPTLDDLVFYYGYFLEGMDYGGTPSGLIDTVTISQDVMAKTISLSTPENMSAVHLQILGNITPTLLAADVSLQYNYNGFYTSILISPADEQQLLMLESGPLLQYEGEGVLWSQTASKNGYDAVVTIGAATYTAGIGAILVRDSIPSHWVHLDPDSSLYIIVGNNGESEIVDFVNIDAASLLVNNSLTPINVEVVDYYPGFLGSAARLAISGQAFAEYYGPADDIFAQAFTVSGNTSGFGPFIAYGNAMFTPYICGDMNGDRHMNIVDASCIINGIFFNGPKPVMPDKSDLNGDESFNIGDATFLINYIFFSGPPPGCDF